MSGKRSQLRIDAQVRHGVRTVRMRSLQTRQRRAYLAERVIHLRELVRRDVAAVLLLRHEIVENLAREAEMCYACMAHVTDYDVWHVEEEPVTVAMVVERLLANIDVSKQAIANLVPKLPADRHCACEHALRDAVITNPAAIPDRMKRDLAPLIGKYLPAAPAKKSNAKKAARKKPR